MVGAGWNMAAPMPSKEEESARKEAKYWEDYRAALKATAEPPDFFTLLAMFWANECGENWGELTKPERDARRQNAGVSFARARDSLSFTHPMSDD